MNKGKESHRLHVKGLYKFYFACVVACGFLTYTSVHSLYKGTGQGVKYGSHKEYQESSIVQNLVLVPGGSDKETVVANQRRLLQEEGEDVECRQVHEVADEDQCAFIQNTSSCAAESAIDYNNFVFCSVGIPWLAMIVLIIWWLFCFNALAVTADDFFCPSLVVISKTLRLSPNVAGVTFLAFGNGAPDLFSAIAALSETEEGDAGLGVGGLFGAGMFVTTIVTGTISIIRPFKAMERPFLRDVIFYMAGVFWTFTTLWRGKMYLAEAIGFIASYVFYVVVVVVSGSIYKKQKAKEEAKRSALGAGELANLSGGRFKKIGDSYQFPSFDVIHANENQSTGMPTSPTQLSIYENMAFDSNGIPEGKDDRRLSIFDTKPAMKKDVSFDLGTITEGDGNEDEGIGSDRTIKRDLSTETMDSDTSGVFTEPDEDSKEDEEEEEEEKPLGSPVRQFLDGINPINVEEWPNMGYLGKFYEIFKSPIIFAIQLTCPVVNYDVEVSHNWNKYLQCFQCLFAPMLLSFVLGFGTASIGDVFPVWALLLLVGIPLCVIVFFTSVDYEKPKYHWVFGYVGFFFSMIWIYTIANAIVSLLGTFGIVFNISDAILGLTLLAWGNSIGDLIADSVMARQGFARMGFAACFGAPFFNLSLGYSIPMIATMVKTDDTVATLFITPVQIILSGFLLFNLCMNIIILMITKFKVTRIYGIIAIVYYIVFLVVAILVESGVFFSDWTQKRECNVDCVP